MELFVKSNCKRLNRTNATERTKEAKQNATPITEIKNGFVLMFLKVSVKRKVAIAKITIVIFG